MPEFIDTKNISTGVVGLGLMGCSITTCLLIAEHPVVAVAPIPDDLKHAKNRITEHLRKSQEEGLVNKPPEYCLGHLTVTEDYNLVKFCTIVIECNVEKIDIK